MSTENKTTAIAIWGFTLNSERFGGYCANPSAARSDAESVCEEKIEELSDEQAGKCYEQLVGYDPLKEPKGFINGDMTGDQVRELLLEMMKEGE